MIFAQNNLLLSSICRKHSAILANVISRSPAITPTCVRNASSKEKVNTPLSEPVKFSKSPAFKFKPENLYSTQTVSDRPWFEPYIIMGSMAVFMIYFFILREESDIDGRLGGKSVEAQLRDYEIQSLKTSLESCKSAGLDTSELEDRLYVLLEEQERNPA